MAIATLGTQQPGQDYSYQQFEYTPVAPPDPMEELYKQAFQQLSPPPQQPRGPTPYWENPATYYPPQQQVNPRQIQQAQEMIAQAMQYQGIRGYQRDLESGKSAAEAMAKWGPMLFAQDNRAFAPAMKAMTPDAAPQWTPPNPATQQPGYVTGKNVRFPPESAMVRPDVVAEQNIKDLGGGVRGYINPRTGALTKLSEASKPSTYDVIDYRQAADRISEANKVLMDQYAPPAVKSAATNAINEAKAILKGIRKPTAQPQAPPAPVTAETAGTAPAVTTAKRVRVKSPEGKVGTISSDNLAEALKAGYKEL